MGDLQRAIDAARETPVRRGKQASLSLLSAREFAYLDAHFNQSHQQTRSSEDLELHSNIAAGRITRFFKNQRCNRKRKAAELDASQPDLPPLPPQQRQSKRVRAAAARGERGIAFNHTYCQRIVVTLLSADSGDDAEARRPAMDAEAVQAAAAAAASAAAHAPSVVVPLAAAAASEVELSTSQVSDQQLDEALVACLDVKQRLPLALPQLSPAVAAVAPADAETGHRRSISAGRAASGTRLELFDYWLRQHRIDPFACARRCDVLHLAGLVEAHGCADTMTLIFAAVCVLKAALEQVQMKQPDAELDQFKKTPPDSLLSWQALLAKAPIAAALSRYSDLLWFHARRDGKVLCRSVPIRARDDTLTALAIVAAVAPHDHMQQLVSHSAAAAAAPAHSDKPRGG